VLKNGILRVLGVLCGLSILERSDFADLLAGRVVGRIKNDDPIHWGVNRAAGNIPLTRPSSRWRKRGPSCLGLP